MKLNNLLENKSHDNVPVIVNQLVKSLNIPVTASSVIESLEQHPNFPSLLSISDSLSKWKIEHIALKVKPEMLEDIPTPFIAHTRKGKGNFVLVNSVNGKIGYSDENGLTKYKAKEEFLKEWDNIVLLAKRNDNSGEQLFKVKRRKEILKNIRIPFILIASVGFVIFSIIFSSYVSLPYISLLLIKLTGCTISSLLLWFELDKSNPNLKQICTLGGKTNCTAVLDSKSSRLFNFISWSEVGFFYFVGSFLFLLIGADNISSSIVLTSWLNVLALPYTFFSIFYQWRIVKQWCPLCLAVQGLLLLEFVAGYFGYWSYYYYVPDLSAGILLLFVLAFLIPVFFWIISKPLYLESENARRFRNDLGKMKYNREILDTLLQTQKAITTSTAGLGITLGNPDAKNTIIKVCNPFCGPCAKAHPVINELLEHNPDVKVQIIFSGIKDDAVNKINMVVKHLMAVYEKNDPAYMKHALDDWYIRGKGKQEAFAELYPLNDAFDNKLEAKLNAMKMWCNETGIKFTPTYFVNGYQLPEVYKVEDLKQIL
ncbi:MAG TPA: vitamin K epoxide reductase family protein [Chitinophagaceae bacterium]|nr:vitamin K epoxide reductase family protein [Chitinophagaceae bacterium]